MKKIISLIVLAGVVAAGAALGAGAGNPLGKAVKVLPVEQEVRVAEQAAANASALERIIAPNPSVLENVSYWLKGCRKVQQTKDEVALNCPPGVGQQLISQGKARQDRLFQVYDLKADRQIDADDVWGLGYEGSGVVVAVLDTGVDALHIELQDSIVATANFTSESDLDLEGHGTHVSGIITGNGLYRIKGNYAKGAAPQAGVIVGKVCKTGGCWESDISAGIEWAVASGADVMNLSLGGGSYNRHCDELPLAQKVNWAVDQGVVAVVSAGNAEAGPWVGEPACASGAIAVGAVDNRNQRASSSSYGEALDIMAPGVNILSTYSCEAAGDCGSYWYAYMSGTSMSAPHVAATVALILEKHPNYTVNEVKEALYETALDLGASGWDELYGWGRVDALAAVNYEGAAPPPPSPPPPPPTDCGDGVCAGIAEGEDCFICPADCRCTGKNCSRSCCGDGKCLNETIKNCPIDCAL